MPDSPFDLLILGAGLRGLTAGLAARRAGARVLVVESAPNPGGTVRTQRSEGFACEQGPIALSADELAPILSVLGTPPPLASVQTRVGALWDGQRLEPAEVDGEPQSGRGGMEDLVTALRRELGPDLRLGRGATAVEVGPELWTVHLGGEVPATLQAKAIHLCTPLAESARLLAGFDPALPDLVPRLGTTQHAFVFLGTWQDAAFAQSCPGYGIACADPASPVTEILFCSNVFPGRAVAGKALVRLELAGAAATEPDPDTLAAAAEAELRRITGWTGRVLFRRVHRFAAPRLDAVHAECRVRLSELTRRVPGLSVG